ncbi:MAG: hypothetical protein KDD33_10050 [Bdellovibrionales bacterium]|nr:hypothetical protein [Bdellovibrionales bacterium]
MQWILVLPLILGLMTACGKTSGNDAPENGGGNLEFDGNPKNGELSNGQVRICGDINTSEVWTSDFEKYVITCDSEITAGTLIEVRKGTTIEIYHDVKLIVKGTLNFESAQGAERSKVMGGLGYDRAGTLSYQRGNHNISGVIFERMQSAIELVVGSINVDNIEVTKADFGFYNYSGSARIRNSHLKGLTYGVYSENPSKVENSFFDGELGNSQPFMVGVAGKTHVRGSRFFRNKIAIESTGIVTENTVQRCLTGVNPMDQLVLTLNTFRENSTNIRSTGLKHPFRVKIEKNNFLDPAMKQVAFLRTRETLDVRNNYWGTLDLSVMEEDIIDKKDNGINGKVLYQPMSPAAF